VTVTHYGIPVLCPTCKRPVWDGGHAMNERECSHTDGEVCRLHDELARAVAVRDATQGLLAMIYKVADEADLTDSAARLPIASLRVRLSQAQELLASYESPTCDHRHPCRCGSGGHPRKCERHPLAYDHHCAELNQIGIEQSKLDEANEKLAEVKRLVREGRRNDTISPGLAAALESL
jgi:hypothetical protein